MSVAEKRAKRRIRLIEVAIVDILENGVEGCSFRTLAKRSGTTTAPFTYEFGSRAKMLDAIAEYTWTRLEPAPADAGTTPLEVLKAKSRRWTPIDDGDVPFVNVYIDLSFHALHRPSLAKKMGALNSAGDATWRKLVERGQAAGQIDSSLDSGDVVAQLWAMSDGFAVARMSHSKHFTSELVERLWSEAFHRLVGAGT
jgi:AcrR family transcriptional regulator